MRAREAVNPVSPFATYTVEPAFEDGDDGPRKVPITLLEDSTKEILSKNNSPDLGFTYSVNPYRGCVHACAYCYARPTHEYLDLGAGTDFDTKIVVKRRAPELLRAAFERRSWTGQLVMFSGVTDCYQPFEKELELTRGCLEVCLEYKNPVSVITKSALVERDVDLLAALAKEAGASVHVSLAFRDPVVQRAIEPWVPTPARRFRVIETLAKAGIPVGVMLAPVIPGLNDDAIAEILMRARAAGATSADMVLLRLPGNVKAVFEERVREAFPLTAEKILHRIRETRGDKLYDSRFFVRGRGEGPYASMIQALFAQCCKRLGLNTREQLDATFPPPRSTFQRPETPATARRSPQLALFQ
jgi:DNA repair photolyase